MYHADSCVQFLSDFIFSYTEFNKNIWNPLYIYFTYVKY